MVHGGRGLRKERAVGNGCMLWVENQGAAGGLQDTSAKRYYPAVPPSQRQRLLPSGVHTQTRAGVGCGPRWSLTLALGPAPSPAPFSPCLGQLGCCCSEVRLRVDTVCAGGTAVRRRAEGLLQLAARRSQLQPQTLVPAMHGALRHSAPTSSACRTSLLSHASTDPCAVRLPFPYLQRRHTRLRRRQGVLGCGAVALRLGDGRLRVLAGLRMGPRANSWWYLLFELHGRM